MYKLRLKRKYRVFLSVLSILLIIFLVVAGLNNYNKKAAECDKFAGHTCSNYEVNLFLKNKLQK